MQTTPETLRPSLSEVHHTAHNQDLIEIPKRAKVDRETEGKKNQLQPQGFTWK